MNKNRQVLLIAKGKGYMVDNNGGVWLGDKRRSLVKDHKGYYTFTIRCNLGDGDVFRRVWVHRLQAYQKYGDRIFDDFIQVRHLNGDECDNSFANIEIGTASDNMMDRDVGNRLRIAKLAASYVSKRVLAGGIEFDSYCDAARHFGISDNGIRKRIKLNWPGYKLLDA